MAERQLRVEPLAGGLVNSRDPSLLQPGELTQADNACYRPHSQSIHKAPSRANYATGLGASVTGLRYAAFDFNNVACLLVVNQVTVDADTGATFNGVSVGATAIHTLIPANVTVSAKPSSTQIVLSSAPTGTDGATVQFTADNVLVAQANGKYKYAVAGGATGTFVDIESVTEGATLEAVHYANKHVLMNGIIDNRVLKSDLTTRAHGLKPVYISPSVTVLTGGAWALVTGVGFYAYWTTEYDKVNGIESDFDMARAKKPAIANVDVITKKVSIVAPAKINPTATHWRLYRAKLVATSQGAADKEDVPLSSGFFVGEYELKDDGSQNTVEDGGGATSTTAKTAGSLGTVGKKNGITWVNDGTANPPTNILGAVNSTFASISGAGSAAQQVLLQVGTFGFTPSTITPPVAGITVTVTGKRTGRGQVSVDLRSSLNPYTQIAQRTVPLTTTSATYTLGSARDTWVGSAFGTLGQWSQADFADGIFTLRLFADVGTTDVVFIDAVSVVITYGETQQLGTLAPFPAITIKPLGITVVTGRNGLPPRATTGDIFQGSLVTNDVTDSSILRYSYPDNIDAFPTVYFLNFETKDQDRVTNIKTLGNVLMVGLNSQIHRAAYLPREVDAEFDRGRATELIESSHGVVGNMAAAVYTSPEGVQKIAYVSRFGLHDTDCYRSRLLTSDLNLLALADPAYLSKCVLINNPERYELLLYYVPLGSGTPTILTKCLRFSYHQQHIKDQGGLKVSGPCDVNVKCAALAVLADGSRPLYAGDGSTGTVYLENQGSVNIMTVKTREMYLAGASNEWNFDEAYLRDTVYAFNAVSPMTVTGTLTINKLSTAPRASGAKSFAVLAYPSDGSAYPERHMLDKMIFNEIGESYLFKLVTSSSADPFSMDYIIIAGLGLKAETSK